MNYIMLNGQQIELTDEQVRGIKESLGMNTAELSTIPAGETFKIGKYEFIVLEHTTDTALVILKSLLHESERFGDNNDYRDSNIDKKCNDFAKEIADIAGEENLIEHTVDLTSDDGLDTYGTAKRKMSLITCEQYRKYVRILDKHKLSKWWWLATPYSTPEHEDADWIKCVAPDGCIDSDCDYYDDGGVRPFCILKSNIFVSK